MTAIDLSTYRDKGAIVPHTVNHLPETIMGAVCHTMDRCGMMGRDVPLTHVATAMLSHLIDVTDKPTELLTDNELIEEVARRIQSAFVRQDYRVWADDKAVRVTLSNLSGDHTATIRLDILEGRRRG
ncbi:hypothetical protein AB1K42_14255 [Roseibium algicola]|uniref:hypothetical protein n=1 Tax=Roseibium algicola TaxID=2857014 RepID=UPI0034576AEC